MIRNTLACLHSPASPSSSFCLQTESYGYKQRDCNISQISEKKQSFWSLLAWQGCSSPSVSAYRDGSSSQTTHLAARKRTDKEGQREDWGHEKWDRWQRTAQPQKKRRLDKAEACTFSLNPCLNKEHMYQSKVLMCNHITDCRVNYTGWMANYLFRCELLDHY